MTEVKVKSMIFWRHYILIILLIVSLISTESLYSQDKEETLVGIALEIFPRLVAVDLDIADKLSPSGKVKLLVYYDSQESRAANARTSLAEKFSEIAGFATDILLVNEFPKEPPTAILVVEKLSENKIAEITDYSVTHHILVFSPFEEDVKQGITAGMSIHARVVPSFNGETLIKSGIRIHEIVLRSAIIYD